jgi:hypothetical protein
MRLSMAGCFTWDCLELKDIFRCELKDTPLNTYAEKNIFIYSQNVDISDNY